MDHILTSRETATLIGVGRAALSRWRLKGGGPEFGTRPTLSETSNGVRFFYHLDAVLDFLASRGASPTQLKLTRRKAVNRHRLRLARTADKMRIKAMIAIRCARQAREAAADAGHGPSIRAIAEGEFAIGARS